MMTTQSPAPNSGRWLNPEADRFLELDRRARALEHREARRLRMLRVVQLGAGGIGEAFATEAFVRGFRKFTLIDPDPVRRKNLKRAVWYRPEHVGGPKVEALAAEMRARDPKTRVEALALPSFHPRARAALAAADLVVAAFDNHFSRFILQTDVLTIGRPVPLLDLGASESFDGDGFGGGRGQVRFFVPGGPCLVCLGMPADRLIDPRTVARQRREGYIAGTHFTPRRVRIPNAHVALEAVELAAAWACDRPFERCLHWDGRTRLFRALEPRRKPGCPLCGEIESEEALESSAVTAAGAAEA